MAPDPLERVTLKALLAAAERGLAPKVEPVVDTYHVAPIRASVRDAAEAVLLSLPHDRPMSFRALVAGIDDRIEIIVRFLASSSCSSRASSTSRRPRRSATSSSAASPRASAASTPMSLDDWDDVPAPVG